MTNTIFYPYKKKPVQIIRRTGPRRKRMPVEPEASPAPSTEPDTLPTKHSCSSDSKNVTQANSSKFEMNCRLEVMDFNETWLVLGTYYH